MRIAGRLASELLDYITPFVKPGVTTDELDKLCYDYMVEVQDSIPAPLNYAPPGHRPSVPRSIIRYAMACRAKRSSRMGILLILT